MNNNNDTIEEQLQKIAESILRIHDKLMSIPYSNKDNKQQSKRILRCAGTLYEAYVSLLKHND